MKALSLLAKLMLFVTTLQLAATTQSIHSARAQVVQPHELLFFKGYDIPDENFMAVWDRVQGRPDLVATLEPLGNFSVVILYHVYSTGGWGWGGGDWWVIAMSLQEDENGMIRQVVIEEHTFFSHRFYYVSVSTRWFYPVNTTEATERISEFESGIDEAWLHFLGPFAIYFMPPVDFGVTIVLNMMTGRLLIAASSVWMGDGELLYVANGDAAVLEVVDVNADQKIDIQDVAIVALAYGSEVEHPDWNPIADLTGATYLVPDGKVDIRDIGLVATHYGINFGEIY